MLAVKYQTNDLYQNIWAGNETYTDKLYIRKRVKSYSFMDIHWNLIL